jgi:hypothetical protein
MTPRTDRIKPRPLDHDEMSDLEYELYETLRYALRSLDIDGPSSAAAVLNVQGRAMLKKIEATRP